MTMHYAHTYGTNQSEWEPLREHLQLVSERAKLFAGKFDAGAWGEVLGRWHDLGKYSKNFQEYLVKSSKIDVHRSEIPSPLDPVNAMLSFLYVMLSHDVRSACESTGLDSQVGFLHRDRPGRPSLALDLMEEFRPVLVDRYVVTLINRNQIAEGDFESQPSGGIVLKDSARRAILKGWQERKQQTILHEFLAESVSIGLFVHLQARLLARHIRGDLDAYPPCFWK